MQFWIFATTLTRRPPDWWCDRQHQYGGQKIQVAAVAFRVHFMQSHRSPMPLSNFFTKRRRGPWCGASVGATGSAPRALACCPWSVMRGLCWNHWFRPSCACVLAALPGNVVQEVRIELCDFCSLKKRDFWAQRKWFKFKCNGPQNFLSFTLRWFTLYEFLAEAPGPEKTNKILAEAPGPEKTDKILMKHVNFQ